MKRTRRLYFFYLFFSSVFFSQAQSSQDLVNKMMPKPVPVSPNVAALGKFGDYQVSYFTGLPEISIPIFEAKSGRLSVPITLSYHASGHKPTDVASWVGLGWSLSAGGQISRSVNGRPDEEWYLDHPLNPTPTNLTSYYYLQNAVAGWLDTEGDVYSYSYPGSRSGKFLFPNGGTYVSELGTALNAGAYLVPYAPIVVKRINGNKYEITDENGVLHRFGTNNAGTSSTEVTNAFNGGNPTLHATTAWNLMEMQAPNSNDAITFKYQDAGHAYRHDVSYTYVVTDQCYVEPGSQCPSPTHGSAQLANVDSDVNQEALQEIMFETGKVVFVLSSPGDVRKDASELRYLDKILIQALVNGSYTTVKTIKFFYSYFKNADQGNAALKLDAIQFVDQANAIIQKYGFTYHTNTFSWNPSNMNYWNARDLWGYYNGATQNTNLILTQSVPYQATVQSQPTTVNIGGAVDRGVNPAYIKEGVLSRIDFPTGGYSEFDYESHKYLNDQSVATAAGGIRVSKITSKESSTATAVVKTYKYGSGESGIGKALFISNQFNYQSSSLYPNCVPATQHWVRTYHSNSSFSIDAAAPVVYPYVTEYFGDLSGTTNGKIVYEFDGGTPVLDVDQVLGPSTKSYRNSLSWKRGNLSRKTVFDNANNKLAETVINYTAYKEGGRLVGLGVYRFIGGNPLCALQGHNYLNEIGELVNDETYKWATYSQNSGALLESQTDEYQFKNGDITKYVMTSTSKSYDVEKLQPTQIVTTHSPSNEQSVTINKYPFQFSNAPQTGITQGIYMLNSKNILTTPLETYSYIQKPNNTNRRVTSGQYTTFKANPSNTVYVVPDSIFVWESPVRKSTYQSQAWNIGMTKVVKDSGLKHRLTVLSYDANGNILAVSKANDTPISYKWGYNNALQMAEITNALPKNVFTTSFEEETVNFSVGGKTGKYSSNNAPYSKALSGLDPGVYYLSYYKLSTKWDYNETLVTVPANGLYTISLPTGQYDEIRFCPKGAQVKTYTYDPLVGMTSMTDTNGMVIYYDYDTFNRLKGIKDNNGHIIKAYDYRYKTTN